MHLENILLHLLNVGLVFLLATVWFDDRPMSALLAAALFALHPLATESVNWISGRTDLLAGSLMLLSALLLAHYRRNRNPVVLVGAGTSISLACLAKESAVAFVAVGFLMMLVPRNPSTNNAASPPGAHPPLIAVGMACSALLLLVSANGWMGIAVALLFAVLACRSRVQQYFHNGAAVKGVGSAVILLTSAIATIYWVRTYAFASSTSKIADTLSLMFADTSYTIQKFLGAGAFYTAKFFVPLPLNFAIREIDPLFAILGVALLTPICCSLMLLSRESSLLLAGAMMLTPALPLAFGTIAWTSYAERYVYLALPFWCLALAGYVAPLNVLRRWAPPALLLLGIAASMTLHRTIQWRTNVGLLGDTARKSPLFREIRAKYFLALIQSGERDKARSEYAALKKLPEGFYDEAPDINMAALLGAEDDYRGALRLYEQVLRRTQGRSASARQGALRAIDDLLRNATLPDRNELLMKRAEYSVIRDRRERESQ